MNFILSPKTSTIPEEEISLDTLAFIWDGSTKHDFLKQINSTANPIYAKINQDTFLGYVYGNILYFHQTVVPRVVNGWPDEKLVGFYDEDDLDEIAVNFSKEFNSLIESKSYKIKKHIVLTRSIEDRFLELLSLFPSKTLITKLNWRVQENRENKILSIQPALQPANYFDYRFGLTINSMEEQMRKLTMFHKRINQFLHLYRNDFPQEIDQLDFIIQTQSHVLDSALKYYFATAVLNYDEIHYLFDLSSEQINRSFKFSHKTISVVEEIKSQRNLTSTFIFNLVVDLRKFAMADISKDGSLDAFKDTFKIHLDNVLSYFHDYSQDYINSVMYKRNKLFNSMID